MTDPVIHARQIEMIETRELAPYVRNARTHPQEQIDRLAKIILTLGWTTPLLIDDGNEVIAGHGRLLAAKQLGIDAVPCVRVNGLRPDQIKALRISDNQIAVLSTWDDDLLMRELADMRDEGADLSLTGFADDELMEYLDRYSNPGTDGESDPDDVPEAPANPVSELGDVWLLGSHRLVCGSSTDADVVDKALAGVKPHLMVTDPPYGVEYDANWRNERVKTTGGAPSDGRATGKVLNDGNADWTEAWSLFPGDVAYVWCASMTNDTVINSLETSGLKRRSQIVWAKSNFAIGRGDYHWQHEVCWYVVKDGKKGHYNGDRTQSTLWQIPKPQKSETGHSTQKPVECMKRPIENNSSPGQAVYEPFSGSGTTIIACEQTGRHCHAIELSPAYVDVGVTRWQTFAGKEAILEATGETFAQVAASRGVQLVAA